VNQLSGVRNSKAYQIEAYYRIIHSYVLTLSEDRMFIDAIKAFRMACRKPNATSVPAGTLVAVREDYVTRLYPEMQKPHLARPRLEAAIVREVDRRTVVVPIVLDDVTAPVFLLDRLFLRLNRNFKPVALDPLLRPLERIRAERKSG
jgi:hypothetical protein